MSNWTKKVGTKVKRVGRAYECDPEKAVGCKKSSCYLNGGPCHQTVRLEWRKEKE